MTVFLAVSAPAGVGGDVGAGIQTVAPAADVLRADKLLAEALRADKLLAEALRADKLMAEALLAVPMACEA